MNVLSLRINAVKNDDNTKKAKQELLQLEVEDFWSEEIKQQIKAINDATITEIQLRELKKFAKLIAQDQPQDVNWRIASKLIAIYFKEQVKHPAKSTIQSSLNQSSEQELIVECIGVEISKRIGALNLNSTEDCSHFISCLNEASQNFKPAIKAVGQQVDIIINLISQLIKACEDQLKTLLSPSQKNEVSHRLHCSLQAAIFCVKNYINDYKDVFFEIKENLGKITSDCVGLMEHKDLPMDVKNNCAMIIVLHSILTRDKTYISWVRDERQSVERRLCLIFGVISTLGSTNVDFKLLADISGILKKIFLESPVDPALMQSVFRSFMQLTKKVAAISENGSSSEVEIQFNIRSIFDTSLSVALLNLEHHMDSTRFMMKETLKNLAEISTKFTYFHLTVRLLREIRMLANFNLKSIVVLAISSSISADQILHRLPQFLEDLLEVANCDPRGSNNNTINCYEALANSGYLSEFDSWFSTYVQPVLSFVSEKIQCEVKPELKILVENLVMRFIKKDKRVLDRILQQKEDYNIGFILLCLSTGKKIGLFEKQVSTDEQWKGIIDFSVIRKAMISADDNVRASALMLIIEARKTVEGFTQQDLDCLLYFLRYNINVQSPSSRQSILGLVKNMFVRLQSVLQSVIKKKDQDSVDFYFGFLVQLQEFCLDNLFEGANFSRRKLSLRILFYIVEAMNERFKQNSSIIWTKEKFSVVMNVMNDSYEANKEMAIEIMKLLPKEVVQVHSSISLEELETMMKSIKPPDSLTASYLMEIVAMFTFNASNFKFDFETEATTSREALCMLTWCVNHLVEGLVTAEKSLIVASITNPLYGFILSIRHLLSKLDLKSLGHCRQWQNFFARLIILCKRLTEVVSPVVNNSSPEGILPNEDYKDLDEETREKWMEISEQVTPQIILLCSWRTIKEVSLLLGDICLKSPLMNGEVELVSVKQILDIGDHFLDLLSKTKHRGAFEQCFFGFSQLCLRLWTCDEPELHKLPSEMLQQMIHSISGAEKENNELLSMKNLCATRRSAGLPFMIQALITSELKVSTNTNFHFVMKNLIRFCRHGEYLETRTHSLNILRALFRCTDLNEAIGEYIADGMKCAILGYGAESWLERNSSTLLFSALMVRIFGVQRTKDGDELHIRNRMSGRLFFLRYPDLYDFFMDQLREAADYVLNVQMNAKLHPLLLLLIRLFPSSTEGIESKLELSGFIPVVSRCTGCVEMKTRVLCGKFVASVLPPTQSMSRIKQLIAVLEENQHCPANISHGILLQILFIVKVFPEALQLSSEGELLIIIKELCRIKAQFRSHLICYGTLLDIIIEIIEKLWEIYLSGAFMTEISQCLESCFDFDDSALFGVSVVAEKFFLLKLMMPNKAKFPLIGEFDSTKVYGDVFHALLNYLLLLSDFDYALNLKDEYEIDPRLILFISRWSKLYRDRLAQELASSKENKNMFVQLMKSKDYLVSVKAFDLLCFMDYEEGDMIATLIPRLTRMALHQPEQLKKSMLKYVNVCVTSGNFFSQVDFKFLVKLATDPSFHVKSSVTDFIDSIAKNYKSITSLDTILYFSKIVLLLLMDDEDEIRRRNTKIVMQTLVQDDRLDVLPTYAQERFIEFLLLPKNFNHLNKYELMGLVILIAVDGENSLDGNILEYRVFDKNEVNIFGETFIIKKQCISSLKRILQEIDPDLLKDETLKIVEACQKFADGGKTDVKKFLVNL